VIRSSFVLAAVAAVVMVAASAHAETYRFVESDGTVHFTNTPTDPLY